MKKKKYYSSIKARLEGLQDRNKASGMIGESSKMFGREMYGILAL